MPDFRDVLRSISGPLKPDALLRVARFLTAGQVNVAEGEMEPGLVQLADGTVWLVNPDGTLTRVGNGGSMPAGAVSVFVYADAASANDAQGSNGDLAVLLDSGNFVQKAGGTWAAS